MTERWTPAYDRMFKPDHELVYGPTCPRFAWLDLCHNARWEDGTRIINGVAIPLKRGEVLASLRWMAQRWEWSVKKVRSFVNLLTHPDVAKLETVRETPQGTVYRIVNYDTYADPGHTAGHSKAYDRGTPGAHPGHKEQQGTSRDNNVVAREVGALCQRLGTDWKLKTPIDDWADELRCDPRYVGVNLAAEIRECAEWHEGKGKQPKAPDRAIRNWLRRAEPEGNGTSKDLPGWTRL